MWKLWIGFVTVSVVAELITYFTRVDLPATWILIAGGWAALLIAYKLGQDSVKPPDGGSMSDPRFRV